MRASWWLGVALVSWATASCTGEVAPLALSEPVRVTGGAFREGDVPGGGSAAITSLESSSGVALPAQLGRRVVGRATEETFAIAVRFRDLGTGYWVVPAGGLDPSAPGERDFALDLALGPVPPGRHRLSLAALDSGGRGGVPTELEICVLDPTRPDDLSPCSPEVAPPFAAVVLTWDDDVDVDLVVRAPDGRDLESGPGSAVFGYDSNAECNIDGRNQESVSWREAPEGGAYLVYANLFEACGAPSVRFTLVVYRRVEDDAGARLVEAERRTGIMLGASANGGGGAPLYVTAVAF